MSELGSLDPSEEDIDVLVNDGYNHLAYFESADSKSPIFLTSGDWEILDERNGFNNVCKIVLTSSELFFKETEADMVNNVLNTEQSIQRFTDFCLNRLGEGAVNDGFRDIYDFVILTRKLHRIWFNFKGNGSMFPVSEDFEEGRYFSASSISRSTAMEGFKNSIPLITLMKTDDLFKKIDDSFQSDTYAIDTSSVVELFQRRMDKIKELRRFFTKFCLINERVSKIAESASEASFQFIFAILMELILDQLNERPEYSSFHFATPGSCTPCKRKEEFPSQSCSDIVIGKKATGISIVANVEIKKHIKINNINESIEKFIETFTDGEESSLNKLCWFFRNLSTYSLVHNSTAGLATDGINSIAYSINCDSINENSAENFQSLKQLIINLMSSKIFTDFFQKFRNRLANEQELNNVLSEIQISNIKNENCFEVLQFIKRKLVEQILLDFEDISAQLGRNCYGPISLTPKLRSFEKLLGPDYVLLPIDVFDFSSETPVQAVGLSYLFHLTTSDIKREEDLKSLEKLDDITRIKSEENRNSEGYLPTFSLSSSPNRQNTYEDFSNYSNQAQDEMLVNNSIDQDFSQDMENLTSEVLTVKLVDDVNLVDYS